MCSTSCRTLRTQSGVHAAIGGVDTTAARAVIAVQGPDARDLVASGLPGGGALSGGSVSPRASWNGVSCVVAGNRATRAKRAGDCGARRTPPGRSGGRCATAGIAPAGLGAPRHAPSRGSAPTPRPRTRGGDHLAPGRSGLGRGVGQAGVHRPEHAAIAERGTRHRPSAGRYRHARVAGPARAECAGAAATVRPVGVVTSGNFSPVLGHGIALAFLPPGHRNRRYVGHG